MIKRIGFFIISAFQLVNINGQGVCLKSMECEGEMPNAFKTSLQEIANGKGTSDFSKQSLMGVQEIFASGNVIYGNATWSYLQGLKERIVSTNKLNSTFQIYLLRSNNYNAFATDEGYIFATTALIAQSITEEEVAFILCHEMAHVILKHNLQRQINIVKEKKEYRVKSNEIIEQRGKVSEDNFDDFLNSVYQFSRKSELEADSLGYLLYKAAGYEESLVVQNIRKLQFANPGFRVDYNAKFISPADDTAAIIKTFDEIKKQIKDSITFKNSTGLLISIYHDTAIEITTHPSWEKRLEQMTKFITSIDTNKKGKPIPVQVKTESVGELVFFNLYQSHYILGLSYLHKAEELGICTSEIKRLKGLCLFNIHTLILEKSSIYSEPTFILNLESKQQFDIQESLTLHLALLTPDEILGLSEFFISDTGENLYSEMVNYHLWEMQKITLFESPWKEKRNINFHVGNEWDSISILFEKDTLPEFTHLKADKTKYNKEKSDYYFINRDAMNDLFPGQNEINPPKLRKVNAIDTVSILFLSPQINTQITRYRYNLGYPVVKENYNLKLSSYLIDEFEQLEFSSKIVGYEMKSNLNTNTYNQIYKLRTTLYELLELPSEKLLPFSYKICEEIYKTEEMKYFYSSYIFSFKIQPKIAPIKLYAGAVALPFTFVTGKDMSSLVSASNFYTNTFSFLIDLENAELKYLSFYNTGQKVNNEKIYVTSRFLANDLKYYLSHKKNEE